MLKYLTGGNKWVALQNLTSINHKTVFEANILSAQLVQLGNGDDFQKKENNLLIYLKDVTQLYAIYKKLTSTQVD